MRAPERIVVVGASLCGLRAARSLRAAGFSGSLTLVGDETHPPYDRPPLSKQVALGMVPAGRTALPRGQVPDAALRLGVAATGIDRVAGAVVLADGSRLGFDRLLVATGVRARRWADAAGDALEGVVSLRTSDDAARLHDALAAGPRRVVVVGGGFTGSEVASACRARGIEVVLIEGGAAPLAGALGGTVAAAAARLQRAHGVRLMCGARVERLEDDGRGRVCRVHPDGGADPIEADLVVLALGSVPNVEWLRGSGLATGPHGLACDPACRVYDRSGIANDRVFAAGDVARFPHRLFGFEFVTLEHWGNAVGMAEVAAHNMLAEPHALRAHDAVPAFWSSQFDVSIKSVGVPARADRVAIVQGSIESLSFVALYAKGDRTVAAVAFDHGKWLPHYEAMIADGADPDGAPGMEAPALPDWLPPGLPAHDGGLLHTPTTLSGHVPHQAQRTGPAEMEARS